MKKIISAVSALAVVAASFTAFAAPYYNDYTKEERNLSNIPQEDKVETKLDITSKISGSSSDYSSHSTSDSALSASSGVTTMTVDAKATLDMKNVAKEWEAYLDAAENSMVDRAYAIANATLEGDYVIKIKGDKAIVNEKLANKDDSGWLWDEMTKTLFNQKSVEYDAVNNEFTLTITLKSKAEDPDINNKLNTYFTSLNDGTADTDVLTLTIPNTTVTAQNTLTSAGEYHQVEGDFSGYVTIGVVVLGAVKSYKVLFDDKDTEYYRFYKRSSGGGGGGGGGVIKPTATPAVPTEGPTVEPTEAPSGTPTERPAATDIPESEINIPVIPDSGASLNYDEHFAYIIGYPLEPGHENDPYSEVRPQNSITRAEVATIFFRLLTDESRGKFWTKDNNFSDVDVENWYNNAVSTAANAGIVNGYDDGTFRPNAPITRAEFAAIASRFSSKDDAAEDKFTDISGHWAREVINKAASTGWINGYDDGTYRPNKNITRAEAMTLINRMLYRMVETEGLLDDMVKWSDNLDTNAWYYTAIQEATNSHVYARERIGAIEKWTELKAAPDWEALEKSWSESADTLLNSSHDGTK